MHMELKALTRIFTALVGLTALVAVGVGGIYVKNVIDHISNPVPITDDVKTAVEKMDTELLKRVIAALTAKTGVKPIDASKLRDPFFPPPPSPTAAPVPDGPEVPAP